MKLKHGYNHQRWLDLLRITLHGILVILYRAWQTDPRNWRPERDTAEPPF